VRIIYTQHARQRMKQRKVLEAEVVETLETPDDILAGYQQEDVAVKRFGTREIRVVYEKTSRETVVIYTVMQRKSQAKVGNEN